MGKMTEQEKMKQGYLWKDDEENMALQARAKEHIKKFNDLPSDDMKGRENLLHDIFGNVGENVWICPPLTAAVGKYVSIGDNSVIGAGSVVTKDIPANVVAFGTPCKVYREIDEHDEKYYFKNRRFEDQPEE